MNNQLSVLGGPIDLTQFSLYSFICICVPFNVFEKEIYILHTQHKVYATHRLHRSCTFGLTQTLREREREREKLKREVLNDEFVSLSERNDKSNSSQSR